MIIVIFYRNRILKITVDTVWVDGSIILSIYFISTDVIRLPALYFDISLKVNTQPFGPETV
jgi:hypothetical protein